MCEVWQKMQTRVSEAALIDPGPLTDRLCFEVKTVLPVAAVAARGAAALAAWGAAVAARAG
ncbi:MAG: hypothetical protein ACJ79L_21205, partial [Anaeromyxobacteraceae bacterium]